jgi:hypothetical protein
MAAGDDPAQTPSPPKPRSPVRTLISWVLVLGLFGALGWDYVASQEYEKVVRAVLDKIGPPDVTVSRKVKAAEIKAIVGSKSPRIVDVATKGLSIGAGRLDVYRWFGVNPFVKRELYVYYAPGEDGSVVSASTIEDKQVN